MNTDTPDNLEDEDAMKESLSNAIQSNHPEESLEQDPFAKDALGNEPEEEEYGH